LTQACLLLPLLACWLPAAETGEIPWPKRLFKVTSHDFGVVARGATIEYRFPVENPYVEDVHVASIRSTCGCTNPTVTKPLLKTWDKGEIVATLDTRRFLGQKEATITVVFDQPFPAEFQLKVYYYVRGDVVFEPGAVQFGSVPQGQTSRKRVCISYAGRTTWKILEAAASAAFLDLQLHEVGRNVEDRAGSPVGQVTYELWVGLKENAPTGYFKEQVVVRTDDADQKTARIPLTVDGLVVPSVSVNPAVLMLGVVKPGETVSKNLVVSGPKPFQIVDVAGPDSQFRFTPRRTGEKLHVIVVQFTAADRPGRISGKIRIKTDVAGASELEVAVDGQVAAPGANDAVQRVPGPSLN